MKGRSWLLQGERVENQNSGAVCRCLTEINVIGTQNGEKANRLDRPQGFQ
jgi:hypothetical protein